MSAEISREKVVEYLKKRLQYDMYDDYNCAEQAIKLIEQIKGEKVALDPKKIMTLLSEQYTKGQEDYSKSLLESLDELIEIQGNRSFTISEFKGLLESASKAIGK